MKFYESLKEAPDARLVKSLSTSPGRAGPGTTTTTTNILLVPFSTFKPTRADDGTTRK
ncbi:hypothetical protein DAPPUDRAFT_236965 [Daphnia pulex]|uniref:Uncharacterized protein n=1 Tax=Daphnia pulex TaxID=6669 RepID=E9G2D6_DAPPU|nr:hypothetical protein DAPPUDRAFT_236965 [Daphnia pulex]|eukprot:EFX86327.1 hypothetical protein DAPPUDRAFT_236965 [Daphnia pulex]